MNSEVMFGIPNQAEIESLIDLLRYNGFPEEDIFDLEVVCYQSDWENWGNMDMVQPGYEAVYTRGMAFLDRLHRVLTLDSHNQTR